MAVTFGFYDSIGGDRPYTADQMGAIFDGIVNDGIYQAIGDAFAVEPKSGMQITVGSGRCWFNHTWTENNDELLLSIAASNNLQSRIDTVVIQIDKSVGARANSIRIIQGTYSSTPVAPALTRSGTLFQYPLADILVRNGATSIANTDIMNRRGQNPTNWVTGPLKVLDSTTIYKQWGDQWTAWFNSQSVQAVDQLEQVQSSNQSDWNKWFADIRTSLSSDAAGALLARIIDLEQKIASSGSGGEYVAWDNIRDQDNNSILDSNGRPIDGKIVYITTQL